MLLGLSLAAIPLGASTEQRAQANEVGAPTQEADVVLIDYRMVHQEDDAGADSGVSPDGRWISYSSSKSGNREIYAVHTETGEVRNLTNTSEDDWEAHWSPDGRKIVYTARRNGQNGVFSSVRGEGSAAARRVGGTDSPGSCRTAPESAPE